MATLGDALRQARATRLLSIKDAAELLGVHASTIQHWEESRRFPCNREQEYLVERLGFDPAAMGAFEQDYRQRGDARSKR